MKGCYTLNMAQSQSSFYHIFICWWELCYLKFNIYDSINYLYLTIYVFQGRLMVKNDYPKDLGTQIPRVILLVFMGQILFQMDDVSLSNAQ